MSLAPTESKPTTLPAFLAPPNVAACVESEVAEAMHAHERAAGHVGRLPIGPQPGMDRPLSPDENKILRRLRAAGPRGIPSQADDPNGLTYRMCLVLLSRGLVRYDGTRSGRGGRYYHIKQVGDTTRRAQITAMLKGGRELTAAEMADLSPISPDGLRSILTRMYRAGLVAREKYNGGPYLYRLAA